MFASIDCMHWEWKNCPSAWKGQYKSGKGKYPTVVLEAIASQNLWIWHAFFGMPGSCNDISIVERSPFIQNVLHNICPSISWQMGGKMYNSFYLLADGIYPKVCFCYFTFVSYLFVFFYFFMAINVKQSLLVC